MYDGVHNMAARECHLRPPFSLLTSRPTNKPFMRHARLPLRRPPRHPASERGGPGGLAGHHFSGPLPHCSHAPTHAACLLACPASPAAHVRVLQVPVSPTLMPSAVLPLTCYVRVCMQVPLLAERAYKGLVLKPAKPNSKPIVLERTGGTWEAGRRACGAAGRCAVTRCVNLAEAGAGNGDKEGRSAHSSAINGVNSHTGLQSFTCR